MSYTVKRQAAWKLEGYYPTVFTIWSLPLLWLIGGERLISPLVIIFCTLAWATNRNPAHRGVPKVLAWAIAFLSIYFISIMKVSGTQRLFTFAWDLSLYIAFFCIIFNANRYIKSRDDVKIILKHLILMVGVGHVLAIAYLLFGEIKFQTLIGYILPGEIKATAAGRLVAIHSVGRNLWFFGLNDRLSAIFGTSIHYGSAIMLTFPAIFYFIYTTKGLKKLAYLATLLVSAYLMIYAQARTATLLSVLIFISMIALEPLAKIRALKPQIVFLGFALMVAALVVVSTVFGEAIFGKFREYFIDARASSAVNRFEVYTRSWNAIQDSPLIGFGTQTTVDDLAIPLGSHNWYLAVLYKQGVLGLIPFLGFLLSAHATGFSTLFSAKRAEDQFLAGTLLVTILSHAALCFTLEPIVGAMHLYILGIMFGLTLALHNIVRREAAPQSRRADVR